MAQKLSHQLRASEDRIAELEAEVAAYRERAERAEQWLDRVYTEIEDRFCGREMTVAGERRVAAPTERKAACRLTGACFGSRLAAQRSGSTIMAGRLAESILFIATLLIAGLSVAAPTSTAHAEDCLVHEFAVAEGSWWDYRLDWPTQRRCW